MEKKQKGAVTAPGTLLAHALDLAVCRESRGISLEEIAESTKISMRFLRAIEAGEYKKLPGGIYDTNYVRQYAAAIAFDEQVLLADYEAIVNPPRPEPRKEMPAQSRGLWDRWFGLPAPQRP